MPAFNPTSEAALNNAFFSKPTNSTSIPSDKAFNIYVLIVIWLSFFLAGVAGNLLVCVTVHKNQNMRTPVNALLVNLAVVDIFFSVAAVLAIMDFAIKDLQAGSLTCKLQIFSLDICYGASMLSLVAISIERYYAVCKPTEFDRVKQKTKTMIIAIWITSGLVYVPMLWACEKRPSGTNRQVSCNCYSKWGAWYNYAVYGTLIVTVLYLLPLSAMLFSYVPVIRRLWGNNQVKRSSRMQAENNEQKKRITKMLIVVVILFFISWTPYNVLYMLKKYQVDFRHVYSYVWYLSLLMAFANSFYNPIVYSAMNRNFRQGFKEIFCSKRKASRTQDEATQSSGETDSSVTSKATSHLEIALQDAQGNPMKSCQINSKVC